MALAITGGQFKGIKLHSLSQSSVTRPTSGKMREALFSIIGPDIIGSTFLDLFAGYGAVGLEAMSRGAQSVELVESNEKIFRVLQKNQKKFPLESIQLWKKDALTFSPQKMDYIFIDPPFTLNFDEMEDMVTRLLSQCDCFLVQFPTRQPPLWIKQASKIKKYGESSLGIFYN